MNANNERLTSTSKASTQHDRDKHFYQLIEENEEMKGAIVKIESLISCLERHSVEGKAVKVYP